MNAETIIKTVCKVYEIDIDQLKQATRTRDISDARKIIAYLLLDYGLCFTYEDAGKVVGLKSNSVYVALLCFKDLLKLNAPFRFRYNTIIGLLQISE